MKQRCYNPNNTGYPAYGGRGITVCPEWQTFPPFAAYMDANLGPCPPKHSLDRIDNDGNYEPGNVRWASAQQQSANSRPNWPRSVVSARSPRR